MKTTKRNTEIFNLRKSGLTYKTIGTKFGVTPERVRIICLNELRRINRPKTPFDALPIRVENQLIKKYSTKEDVYNAVVSGELAPNSNELMYGQKAHKCVCDWLCVNIN